MPKLHRVQRDGGRGGGARVGEGRGVTEIFGSFNVLPRLHTSLQKEITALPSNSTIPIIKLKNRGLYAEARSYNTRGEFLYTHKNSKSDTATW